MAARRPQADATAARELRAPQTCLDCSRWSGGCAVEAPQSGLGADLLHPLGITPGLDLRRRCSGRSFRAISYGSPPSLGQWAWMWSRAGGKTTGRCVVFSSLNVDAVRLARQGNADAACAMAKLAERVEAAGAFVKRQVLLSGCSSAVISALLEGVVAPGGSCWFVEGRQRCGPDERATADEPASRAALGLCRRLRLGGPPQLRAHVADGRSCDGGAAVDCQPGSPREREGLHGRDPGPLGGPEHAIGDEVSFPSGWSVPSVRLARSSGASPPDQRSRRTRRSRP